MSRKVFDRLTSGVGILMVVVLLVAGGLLIWGHSFVNSNVHSQLARQDITFPSKAAFAHPKPGSEITAAMIPSVSKYAGQQLLTGPQAEAYADHFIAVHLSEMPYGGVYLEDQAQPIASPTTQVSKPLSRHHSRDTGHRRLFSRLAFARIRMIMLWAAIAAFAAALVMSVLVGVGLWHASRTAEETELMGRQAITTA